MIDRAAQLRLTETIRDELRAVYEAPPHDPALLILINLADETIAALADQSSASGL